LPEFVPENWVIFKLGERKTLHFYDHGVVEREITDPLTGSTVRRRTVIFYVDYANRVRVDKLFSVMSVKLAQELSAYIPERRYVNYEFEIFKPEFKWAPPRIVEVRPWVAVPPP